MRRTALFGIEIPEQPARDWGDKVVNFFQEMEEQLGCNSNLAMAADTGSGTAAAFGLCSLASADTIKAGNPSAGRWGRVVPQVSMVNGHRTLCRLLGVTRMLGVEGSIANQTVYHDADSARFTLDVDDAIVADATGIRLLPLGYAFGQDDYGFLNGLRPVLTCPNRPTGQGVQYKPGVNDPAGSFAAVFDAGPALSLTFDVSGTQQFVDLVFQVAMPADFLAWSTVDSANVWAFKALFKTTGDAQVSVQSVIDTAGAEHAITGVSGTSIGAYGSLLLRHKKISDAAGTWTPSGTMALRLRCQGSTSAVVRVRSTCLMQYLPAVVWSA